MTFHDRRLQPRRRYEPFHPGEVVVVARVPRAQADSPQLGERLHAALAEHVGHHLRPDPATTRTFVFNAPDEPRSLVFSFHHLSDRGSQRTVKRAVDELHQRLGAIGGDQIDVLGVMPHWHMRAHDDSAGPSPGTYPRPVYPDQASGGWTHRFYQPINPRLDLTRDVDGLDPVPVAVLDAQLDLDKAGSQGERFKSQAHNAQLLDTVECVRKYTAHDERYAKEFQALEPLHTAQQALAEDEPRPYPIPDHGLFIAGLIHGIAPNAPLSLEPVLDETGLGDLSLLLLGLKKVLDNKGERDPRIINLSLGFLPHPARLPAIWYGFERPYDSEHLHMRDLYDRERDEKWVVAHRSQVDETVNLLQTGLRALARYLSLNNCLVVAASGNDSLESVETGQARMEPRLPARFDTVLGVAATTSDPRKAAPYSNIGDERELGDHVATFGGSVTDGLQPEDGVIGIYAGDFPFDRLNETGWAFWSGTSFATAIISGIAANLWARRRRENGHVHASEILADLHAEALRFGPYVPELRTPAIAVQGRWS